MVEVVVGYLTVHLLRGARHVADRTIESLLDRLAKLVEARLGPGPLDTLAGNPADAATQTQVRRNIEAAARTDPAFAQELDALRAELDQRGGREIINQVYAQMNVQAFDHGMAAGRDLIYAPTDFNVPDPSDLSGAPAWVKLFIGLGFLTCVTGLGIFFYTLFTDMPDLNDPDFGETPPGIPLAFGIFFVGFAIVAIGSIGRAMSKRR